MPGRMRARLIEWFGTCAPMLRFGLPQRRPRKAAGAEDAWEAGAVEVAERRRKLRLVSRLLKTRRTRLEAAVVAAADAADSVIVGRWSTRANTRWLFPPVVRVIRK